jgi:riboflavin biosynthesis pyrimidine reductase
MTWWTDRFAQFAARKTGQALAAALPPYLTEHAGATADLQTIGSPWSKRIFDGPFFLSPPAAADRPACNLVFVQSLDGNTGARDPSTLGGGETDHHLIYEGLSRVAADAVLAGAGTIRGGDIVLSVWHPELVALRESLGYPRHPAQIVATLNGVDIERQMMFNVPALPAVLITAAAGAASMQAALTARPWIRTVVVGAPADLPAAFEELAAMGINRVSAIGGPRLATALMNAELVQDLYLTTAPRAGGEPDTPWYPGSWTARLVVRKRGTGAETGVTFEHWRGPAPISRPASP